MVLAVELAPRIRIHAVAPTWMRLIPDFPTGRTLGIDGELPRM